MKVNLIVAASENNVIGIKNDLPWSLPDDMKYFKEKTLGHFIIMGRKNYISIPEKFRPLPNRENAILTTKEKFVAPGCLIFNSLESALEDAKLKNKKEVFIIGGGEIYKYALEKKLVDIIFLTRIHTEIAGDTFFPKIDLKKWTTISELRKSKNENHKYDYTFFVLKKN